MNKKILVFIFVAVVAVLVGSYIFNQLNSSVVSDSPASGMIWSQKSGGNNQNGTGNISKGNCLSDECLTVSDLDYPVAGLSEDAKVALGKALDDEFKAHAVYQNVINKFGMVRPFSMIIRAEEQHISSLKSLFDKYGLPIPKDVWISGKILIPATLKQACQTGVDAEIDNAKLYRDELLAKVKDYEDITNTFTSLMDASQQKHLVAFEKCN